MTKSKSFNPINVQEELNRLYNIPENEITTGENRSLNYFDFLSQRGVNYACTRCNGLGTITYGSGSTWRGGVGGAVMTIDVCNHCWGSGDEFKKWPSHKLLKK